MALNIDDPSHLNGATVIGGDGQKLGNVDGVYYDNATERPEWVAVRSGLFGTRVTLVPLRRADYAGDELHVPFDKVQLKNAPHHDPGRELSSAAEADLYRYYGLDYTDTDDSVETTEFAIDLAVDPERDVRDHRYL
jgi:PRC-barrel domain